MADTTTTTGADAYAGHSGNNNLTIKNNPANRAPADQPGFDPKDAKWANIPGAAAREGGFPRLS